MDHLLPPLDANNNNAIVTATHIGSDHPTGVDTAAVTAPVPCAKDKYSLRPRSLRSATAAKWAAPAQRQVGSPPAAGSPPPTNPDSPPQKPPSKHRAAPLSKYRRKTANARERNRMREINQAFETLRQAIPQMQENFAAAAAAAANASEKLTKITTLRLAMKYIATLSASLQQQGTVEDLAGMRTSTGTMIVQQDASTIPSSGSSSPLLFPATGYPSSMECCFLLESDGESSVPQSDQSSLSDLPEPSLSPCDFGTDPCLPALLHSDFGLEDGLEPDDFGDFLLT